MQDYLSYGFNLSGKPLADWLAVNYLDLRPREHIFPQIKTALCSYLQQ